MELVCRCCEVGAGCAWAGEGVCLRTLRRGVMQVEVVLFMADLALKVAVHG